MDVVREGIISYIEVVTVYERDLSNIAYIMRRESLWRDCYAIFIVVVINFLTVCCVATPNIIAIAHCSSTWEFKCKVHVLWDGVICQVIVICLKCDTWAIIQPYGVIVQNIVLACVISISAYNNTIAAVVWYSIIYEIVVPISYQI